MSPPPPPFDASVLRRLHEELGSDAEATRDIVQTFIRSSADLVAEARAALARADAAAVRRVAHTLKSSAGTLGALRLAELCRGLEARLIGGGDPTRAEVEALADEFERARALVEAWKA